MKQTASFKIIGPYTRVNFTDLAANIPAKVDTGADSSSLWASSIKETPQGLSFELFGPSSPFYTGHVVTVDNYVLRSIKNSFGIAEFRYKIALKIEIEGKSITTRFTLSDRSQNKYPVLIGRRTLAGKFVVDVNKKPKVDQPARVAVLVNGGNFKFEPFYESINKDNKHTLRMDVIRYDDLSYTIRHGQARVCYMVTNTDLSDYDMIYFKTATKNAVFASIIASYAHKNAIPYIDQAVALLAPNSKLHQTMLMALHGVGVPDSMFLNSKIIKNSYPLLAQTLGTPFILKDNYGRKSRNNYLIHSQKDFTSQLKNPINEGIEFLAQTYIPSDGYFRVLVMSKQAKLAMFRSLDQARSHTFDVKLDGQAVQIPLSQLPGEVIKMCIHAASQLGWQIAGVDIMQDKLTGKWYCLEVNNSPQLVSGPYVEEKKQALVTFFKNKLSK